MTMDKDKALKMAIEALDDIELCDYQTQQKALKACKEALEQPAQEYLTRAQQVIRANNSAQEPVVLNETILTAPKKIYLMVGDEYENNEPFPDNSIDVCWSTGKDFDNDVPYIRADLTHHAPSWQGLDAVEVSNIFISKEVNGDATQFARAIEQALKEKNGFV